MPDRWKNGKTSAATTPAPAGAVKRQKTAAGQKGRNLKVDILILQCFEECAHFGHIPGHTRGSWRKKSLLTRLCSYSNI